MKLVQFKNRADWLEWRYTGIGGSEAPAVMGVSPWLKRKELWGLKLELTKPKPCNKYMRRGLELEPLARANYERQVGFASPVAFVESGRFPWLICSVDGLNVQKGRAFEMKCPGPKDHAVALAGKIPAKYIWQCVHILAATELEWCDYFSFDGKKGVIVPFRRDLELEKRLLSEESAFWDCVYRGIPPPPLKVSGKTFQEKAKNVIQLRRSR